MKKIIFLIMIALVISISFFTGCKDRREADAERKVTAGDVGKEAGEALETAAKFTEQQKREYQKKIEVNLREINTKLEDMKKRAVQMGEEAKNELNEELERLEKKKVDAEQKLSELKTTTGKAWEDIKAGLDEAMDDMNEAFQKATSRFR